jgi:hypothetical protein
LNGFGSILEFQGETPVTNCLRFPGKISIQICFIP